MKFLKGPKKWTFSKGVSQWILSKKSNLTLYVFFTEIRKDRFSIFWIENKDFKTKELKV